MFSTLGYKLFPCFGSNTQSSTAFNISIMPVWSAAIRAMQAGSSNAKLLVLSDSTGAGFGSPTTNSFVGSAATNWPTVLQSLLNTASFPSLNKCFFNDANVEVTGATLPQFDSRVTLGAGWGAAASANGFGGTSLVNTTTTNAISFTPGTAFDTIEVYYFEGINGAFTTDIGGASLGTTTTTAGAGASIKKVTF